MICGQDQCLFDLLERSFAAENVALLLVIGLGLLFSLLFMLGFILWEGSFDEQRHNSSFLLLIWVPANLSISQVYQLPLLLGGLLLHFDIAAVGHLSHFFSLSLLHLVLFVVGMALDLFAARVQVVLLHFRNKSYSWTLIASEIPAGTAETQ